MISPEVINFDPPKFLNQEYTVKREQIFNKVPSEEYGNHFHGITAVLPGEISEIAEVQDYFLDSIYYRVENFPVYKLLEPDFLSAFIKKGCLDARSLGTWSDVDQSISLESGKLHLSVGKDVYQELGLSGHRDITSSRQQTAIYRVTIDLRDEKFIPDSKYYKRVFWCLKNQVCLQFDWIMSWQPHNVDICPSSFAAYLDLLGFGVVQCKPKFEERILTQTDIPMLHPETDLLDVVEWVGAAALNITCPKEEDYASSMICPEPSYKSEKVHILKWRGFFLSTQAKHLLGLILRLHPEVTETSQPAWLNLTFHGFDEFRTAPNIWSVFTTTSDVCHVFTSQTSRRKMK
ncbi:ribonuclease P protein subunit p40-like [Daphnia carinata]|uniref:ribonuclease P protein subunit p40-like n=1 Tax=Daphnia carinata TaxID=120202 RepID=UPI0025809927|nr:ribonuclease P protein subunit p40-like [Daphnia carinata]